MTLPLWLDTTEKFVPALITLIFGAVAARFAALQHQTNSDKLRLDLFSRRFEAFEKLQEFFSAVLREGCVTQQMLLLLWEARVKARFLYGTDIDEYFDTLWKTTTHMSGLQVFIKGEDALPVGPERTKIIERDSKEFNLLLKEISSTPERFAKYLRFGQP